MGIDVGVDVEEEEKRGKEMIRITKKRKCWKEGKVDVKGIERGRIS